MSKGKLVVISGTSGATCSPGRGSAGTGSSSGGVTGCGEGCSTLGCSAGRVEIAPLSTGGAAGASLPHPNSARQSISKHIKKDQRFMEKDPLIAK